MKEALQAVKLNAAADRGTLADYVELSKPEVTTLILVATAVGFCAGSRGEFRAGVFLHTMLGTLLVAAGTAALNQFFERDSDALMRRTSRRPLPAGRLAPWRALLFGLSAAAGGVVYLAATTNLLAAVLAASTTAAYLMLYTPLKRRTTACTTVGAFPGAVPPLIGWAAAAGELGTGAWILFAILFLWQFPHFLSIAWLYREDYSRAGIFMLPVVEPDGASTARQIMICCAALVPSSLLPAVAGMTGLMYSAGALLLGVAFLYFGARMARSKTGKEARRLLHASVIYLPLLYGLLLLDRL